MKVYNQKAEEMVCLNSSDNCGLFCSEDREAGNTAKGKHVKCHTVLDCSKHSIFHNPCVRHSELDFINRGTDPETREGLGLPDGGKWKHSHPIPVDGQGCGCQEEPKDFRRRSKNPGMMNWSQRSYHLPLFGLNPPSQDTEKNEKQKGSEKLGGRAYLLINSSTMELSKNRAEFLLGAGSHVAETGNETW